MAFRHPWMVYSEQGNGGAFCVGCAIRPDCDTCTCHMHVVDRSLSVAKISVHLQIACTIPLIFCKYAERSASVLLQLNNYMQASVGKSQLSHLGLLQIHYDTFVDLVKVVDCYVQLHQLQCYQPAFINLPLIYGLSTGNKNSPIPISVYRTVTQHQWPRTCGRCWSMLHVGRRWLPHLLGAWWQEPPAIPCKACVSHPQNPEAAKIWWITSSPNVPHG